MHVIAVDPSKSITSMLSKVVLFSNEVHLRFTTRDPLQAP